MLRLSLLLGLLALCRSARADGVDGDGIVAVLSAPVDAVIDAAFDAVGYDLDDGDGDD